MIGKILKTIRKNANLTQEQLANKVFIGRSTLSDYEREKTDINFADIEKICDICGYEVIFLNKKTKQTITSKNIERKEL